jgi:hypothetical protein
MAATLRKPQGRERQGNDDALVPLSHKTYADLGCGTARISNKFARYAESARVPKNTRFPRHLPEVRIDGHWSDGDQIGSLREPSRGSRVRSRTGTARAYNARQEQTCLWLLARGSVPTKSSA